jgi:hypothetical protein
MEQNEDRRPVIEETLAAPPTEASLRLQVTDLLLRRPQDVRMGRSTREQSDVLRHMKRRWRPTGATSTRPSTANEEVTVPDAGGRTYARSA